MSLKPDALSVQLGFAGSGVSMTWSKAVGDERVARRVLAFLEDRRVLFGQRHLEDEWHCVRSAQEIRVFLTEQIGAAETSAELAASLRAMRAASRKFIDAAGPRAENFRAWGGDQSTHFGLALGDLRTLFGLQVARISATYGISIDPELASICPPVDNGDDPQDLSWLPGVE